MIFQIDNPQQTNKNYRVFHRLNSQEKESKNNISISAHSSHTENSMIILSTANIYIQDNNKNFVQCRCLLDGGSQSNFITSELVKRLKLRVQNINFPISGIGVAKTNISESVHTKIKSMYNKYSSDLTFLVLDNITGNIPHYSFDSTLLNIPEGLVLADNDFNISQKIDILLGASVFYELLIMGQISLGKNAPLLQNSKLGWLIAGKLSMNVIGNNFQTCLFSTNDSIIQSQLERFWSIEDSQYSEIKYTEDEKICENHFINNYQRDNTGRFIVSLPV